MSAGRYILIHTPFGILPPVVHWAQVVRLVFLLFSFGAPQSTTLLVFAERFCFYWALLPERDRIYENSNPLKNSTRRTAYLEKSLGRFG